MCALASNVLCLNLIFLYTLIFMHFRNHLKINYLQIEKSTHFIPYFTPYAIENQSFNTSP